MCLAQIFIIENLHSSQKWRFHFRGPASSRWLLFQKELDHFDSAVGVRNGLTTRARIWVRKVGKILTDTRIRSAQCRRARELVGMDQATLAVATRVSRNRIVDLESGLCVPSASLLAAARRALGYVGVEFSKNGRAVSLRPRPFIVEAVSLTAISLRRDADGARFIFSIQRRRLVEDQTQNRGDLSDDKGTISEAKEVAQRLLQALGFADPPVT
jgi:transcriptional regulator with XRE-family HTH domain